jgi:hypothetical protein
MNLLHIPDRIMTACLLSAPLLPRSDNDRCTILQLPGAIIKILPQPLLLLPKRIDILLILRSMSELHLLHQLKTTAMVIVNNIDSGSFTAAQMCHKSMRHVDKLVEQIHLVWEKTIAPYRQVHLLVRSI